MGGVNLSTALLAKFMLHCLARGVVRVEGRTRCLRAQMAMSAPRGQNIGSSNFAFAGASNFVRHQLDLPTRLDTGGLLLNGLNFR